MLARATQLFARGATLLNSSVRGRFPFGAVGDLIQQRLAIPTYFGADDNSHWSDAAKAKSLLGIVVINPASGPGYTPEFRGPDPEGTIWKKYKARIEQMQLAGSAVVGYVTTNYRDSSGDNTVQGEHTFTVTGETSVATLRTGWSTGFGPIQVRSKTPAGGPATPPGGLAQGQDYFWIASSENSGRFATSKSNALNGAAINLTSAADPQAIHVMGLSRNLKNITNVFFEIDEYYARWPAIDGMFFDEMNNDADTQNLGYYRRIFDYVQKKGGKALVIQNPGTRFPYVMRRSANVFLSYEGPFESPGRNYADHDPEAFGLGPFRRARFWHAVYNCPAAEMPGVIAASRMKGAHYIYVTDKSQDDAWNQITPYFLDEIRQVRSRNTPPLKRV